MTRSFRFLTVLALTAPLAVSAQDREVRIRTVPDIRQTIAIALNGDRPMIGVTTVSESQRDDTLGLRIESVTDESPAAKAGLKAGDRLQRVNTVSLRADRADAGEDDYSGVLNRRLAREIEKTELGQSVQLVVYSEGRTRNVTVTPVKASEISPRRGYIMTTGNSDRAVLGISTNPSGNARDTLGVFIASVTTDGPADKAGIVEGDRIASINGVNLRVAREDAGDAQVSSARAARLTRELAKLTAGDVAELVVVSGGRSRTVRVTTMKASEVRGSAWEALEGWRIEVPRTPMAPLTPMSPMAMPAPAPGFAPGFAPAPPRTPVPAPSRSVPAGPSRATTL